MGTGRAGKCPTCEGAWVPFASLESVMPRLAELAPQEVRDSGDELDTAEKLKCPECGGDLVSVRSNEVRGAAVRTCLVCFGRWIDGAELAKLRRRGFFGRLLDAFRPKAAAQSSEGGEEMPPASPLAEESARSESPEGEENRD
jgi:Zn-finger nucleic acid-binding protein